MHHQALFPTIGCTLLIQTVLAPQVSISCLGEGEGIVMTLLTNYGYNHIWSMSLPKYGHIQYGQWPYFGSDVTTIPAPLPKKDGDSIGARTHTFLRKKMTVWRQLFLRLVEGKLKASGAVSCSPCLPFRWSLSPVPFLVSFQKIRALKSPYNMVVPIQSLCETLTW